MPEALILESVNPQYHERLFIEFPEKYNFRTFCVQILFCMSKQKQKNNFCTQHVLNLYFFGEFNQFNEQSFVILWVNWCKNEGFWKRFTFKKVSRYLLSFFYVSHYVLRVLKTSLLDPRCQTYVSKNKIA